MAFSTIRIRDNIKALLEQLAGARNVSTASALESIVESNLGEDEYLVDLNGNLYNHRVSNEYILKNIRYASSLEVFYWFWTHLTDKQYQQEASLVNFINLYNFTAVDIQATFFPGTLDSNILHDWEKNNLASLSHVKNMIFNDSSDLLNSYNTTKEMIVSNLNKMDFAYPSKINHMFILDIVINNEELNKLFKENKLIESINKLQNFATDISRLSRFDKHAELYELGVSHNSRSFKMRVMEIILKDYDIALMDKQLLHDIVKSIHHIYNRRNYDLLSGTGVAILKIAAEGYQRFKNDLMFEDGRLDYLCSNLGRTSNTLEGCLGNAIKRLESDYAVTKGNLEMSARTPLQIMERIASSSIEPFKDEGFTNIVAKYLPILLSAIAAEYSSAGSYWFDDEYLKKKKIIADYSGCFVSGDCCVNFLQNAHITFNFFNIKFIMPYSDLYKMIEIVNQDHFSAYLLSQDKSIVSGYKEYVFKEFRLIFSLKEKTLAISNNSFHLQLEDEHIKKFEKLCKEIVNDDEYIKNIEARKKYFGII